MTQEGREDLDPDRPSRAGGFPALLRRMGSEMREAFESSHPTSAEWCIAGEILGAVPVRLKEPENPRNPGPQ